MSRAHHGLRRLTWSLLAASILVVTISPASGSPPREYRDYERDPDATFHLDSTTRSVWIGKDGRRWLMVAVTPFQVCCGRSLLLDVHLDTDGDRVTDYVMWADAWRDRHRVPSGMCGVRGHNQERDGHIRLVEGFIDSFVACHVPVAFMQPTARIAWWVKASVTPSAAGGPCCVWVDRAPNVGWYV